MINFTNMHRGSHTAYSDLLYALLMLKARARRMDRMHEYRRVLSQAVRPSLKKLGW